MKFISFSIFFGLSLVRTDFKIAKNDTATGVRVISKNNNRKEIQLVILVRQKLESLKIVTFKSVLVAALLEYRPVPAHPGREYGEAGVLVERNLVILSKANEGYFNLEFVPADDYILKQHKLNVTESYIWHSGQYVLKK